MYKLWKRVISLTLSLALLIPLAACGGHDVESGAGQSDYPVTINEVTLSAEPEGVAVLSPNLADVVLALRYEVSLKARSEDCTQSDLAILPTVSLEDPQAIRDSGATLVLRRRRRNRKKPRRMPGWPFWCCPPRQTGRI